jgi:hypothetical protein
VTINLQTAALAFGQEVQDLLDAVLPRPHYVPEGDRRVRVVAAERNRYSIRIAQRRGLIALTRNGASVASLRITFKCTTDTSGRYLAVQRSSFELQGLGDRIPLARLDYDRGAHTVPAAHWNVHAERGTVSNLLGKTNPDHPGLVSKLHFTVGGSRMRPCLEDFIDLMAYEFQFDLHSGASNTLEAGREQWRRKQIAALVRDAPDEAVRVLDRLGYSITPPTAGPPACNTRELRRR